jgi:hypothetical protein
LAFVRPGTSTKATLLPSSVVHVIEHLDDGDVGRSARGLGDGIIAAGEAPCTRRSWARRNAFAHGPA